MELAMTSIDFIRGFFKQDSKYETPRIQTYGYSGLGSSFYGTASQDYMMSTFGASYSDFLRMDNDLIGRYIDYEDMADSSLISSCLDIYADDASIPDHTHKKSIWVTSDDSDVSDRLNYLLDKRLNIEEKIWGHLRSLCMYGNLNLEQVVVNMEGVKHINFLPAPLVRKIEVPRENKVVGYIYDQTGAFKLSTKDFLDRIEERMNGKQEIMSSINSSLVYEDWEVVHMKLHGKKLDEIYGHGVADGARWVFKRLTLLEDSILLHRLTRAPGRFAFYVDVSNIPPNETTSYLNQVKAAIKKKNYINPETKKFDHRYDVLSSADDFFLPMRGGVEQTRVETLAGPVYDHIEDVKFFENKLFAALKVPKPFLTYEESTAKTNLSAEDARFARTIMRIQREYRNGIKKICDTDLAARRINPDNVDYKVNMTVPSAVFELAQLEIKNAQLELANNFKAWAPKYWIMTEILHFSDDEIATMEDMRLREIEAGDESGGDGGPSGAIGRASERRKATPPTEAPSEAPPTPEWRQERNSDKYLMDGNHRKLSDLKAQVEDLRRSNRGFDKTLKRIENYSRDLQSALRK